MFKKLLSFKMLLIQASLTELLFDGTPKLIPTTPAEKTTSMQDQDGSPITEPTMLQLSLSRSLCFRLTARSRAPVQP